MKSLIQLLLVLLAIVSCKQKNTNSPIQKDEVNSIEADVTGEWITLFDGSSLDNWRGYLADSMYPEWTIENKTLAFTPSENGGKNIITNEKYTNFVLSLEWKISEGGNSGIFWGVYEDEAYPEAYHTGLEIQVLDNDRHPDANANPKFHQAGALYDLVEPAYDVCKPAGEWNLCEIKIDHNANKGSASLNGIVIVEFPLRGEAWKKMIENSKFKDWKGFGTYKTGHIGLQDHGDKVWYRNIKIKEL
ncbi:MULTISPECIES: 3-keto-disaccharide hydrolase [Hwangdonia]|uniref:DUF1080 domain-containing protein n=1 Tax=Hwangdonia seohaensis TaxID=1240727 RepID=A0ABW3RBI0_9FLAO|nr:DUF1080 domain-containing protein [Hwangdonia seohaensis]